MSASLHYPRTYSPASTPLRPNLSPTAEVPAWFQRLAAQDPTLADAVLAMQQVSVYTVPTPDHPALPSTSSSSKVGGLLEAHGRLGAATCCGFPWQRLPGACSMGTSGAAGVPQ